MFDQFALHERLLKAVAELKFVEPTPVQVAAIPPALEGRDLRVTAQTGSGKTAAFVLPMLNRLIGDAQPRVDVRALILLPTRELAQQTLKEVERFSQFTFIKSGLITGGEDFKVQAAMLRKVPDVLIGTPGRRIVVAWKDTPEARRAVSGALPFLRSAGQVFVVTTGQGARLEGAEEVAAHLKLHGAAVTTHLLTTAVSDGEEILRFAREQQADLIVMGAYGHSRLREWAFGGATRDILQANSLCCLMAH
ncbi:DEAD/DEAH box helicase [Methylobacterium organophilum]|nr:DEAD/DEAH box helicase [Methylobacterium organophilum]